MRLDHLLSRDDETVVWLRPDDRVESTKREFSAPTLIGCRHTTVSEKTREPGELALPVGAIAGARKKRVGL